jgi:hypothetical protein
MDIYSCPFSFSQQKDESTAKAQGAQRGTQRRVFFASLFALLVPLRLHLILDAKTTGMSPSACNVIGPSED